MNVDKGELTRRAIDVMTAWTTADHDNSNFVTSRVMEYIGGDPDEAVNLTIGLVNLAGKLLLKIESTTGANPQTTLQEIAKITLRQNPKE